MTRNIEQDIKDKLDEQAELRALLKASDEELFTLLEYIKVNIEPDQSRRLIACINARLTNGKDVPHELLIGLAQHAFPLICEGKSADEAFGLKSAKGKYSRGDKELHNMQIAALVCLQRRKNINWEDSISDVAEHLGVSDISIIRSYEKYREEFQHYPNETLEILAGDTLFP